MLRYISRWLLLAAALVGPGIAWATCPSGSTCTAVDALPAGSSIGGTNLTICDQSGVTNSCTYSQVLSYIESNLGTFATQNYATPPAIGGTTPAAGAFTTLSSSSTTTLDGTTIPASETLLYSGGALGTPSSGNGSNITNVDAASVGGYTLPCTVPSLVSGDYLTNNGSTCSWSAVSGSGVTLQTNSTNNSSQSALNLENGNNVAVANTSGGNVTFNTTQPNRTVTTSTDTISCTTDAGGFINYDETSATVAVSVPQATGSCGSGFGFSVENTGAYSATLTPTTSTINGAASLIIPVGFGCSIVSNGTNYIVGACTALQTLATALASGTTVTPNCGTGIDTVTITGNATIDAPTGCTPYTGQKLLLIVQSASSYTYTASAYITGSTTGSWPASSTGSSKDDHFQLIYDGYLGTPGWVLDAYNLGL